MTAVSPTPAQIERFRDGLEALTGGAPGRLGVAVSGGPDSLALLVLARVAYPGEVEAATVDHALRPESADEAAEVASLCARLGVPHRTVRLAWPAKPAANLQAVAREARYIELGAWAAERGIPWLATGHHLDDQAETLLMRLARGAGVGGLAGIRPIGLYGDEAHPVWAVRPLLGWRKAELAGLVEAAGLEAVEDPSNRDERFDRTRARRLLAERAWLAPERLAAAAANLAEAEEALSWTANRLFAERVRSDGSGYAIRAGDLPDELQRRLVRDVLRLVGEEPPGPKLTRLIATLRSGGTATLAGMKATGGEIWRLGPAPPRRRSG